VMSVHPEGGGSVQDAKVSLISIDVVFGLLDVVGPSNVTLPVQVVVV
jgi:hypothetical protein